MMADFHLPLLKEEIPLLDREGGLEVFMLNSPSQNLFQGA